MLSAAEQVTMLEPQDPSVDVFDLHQILESTDFVAQKMWYIRLEDAMTINLHDQWEFEKN